jgi:dolichol-phosphate mannosyltransferase
MGVYLLLLAVVTTQAALAVLVFREFLRVANMRRIPASTVPAPFSVSVIVPVLNEEQRLPAMLQALIAEAGTVPEIIEILIVDGGSTDTTRGVVMAAVALDPRVLFVDASPVPVTAVGKAWGLQQGAAVARGDWLLTLDADTIVAPGLTRALAAFVQREKIDALSVATRQLCAGWLQSMLHPAFLTTLVYRFGPPGYATRDARRVMANGQCFFAAKAALVDAHAIGSALSSLCEDITMARTLAKAGYAVGFYETDVPVVVQMYGSAREVWTNWPRSLVMRDRHAGFAAALPLAQVLLLQAAPLPLLALALIGGLPLWFVLVQALLLVCRLGVLAGVNGSYAGRAPSFWLSPLLDVPVALRLLAAQFQRRLVWRGRVYVRSRDGTITAVSD